MTKKRIACPMRHENGNCLPAGGFCTAVNDCICEALHNAFYSGRVALAEEFKTQQVKTDLPNCGSGVIKCGSGVIEESLPQTKGLRPCYVGARKALFHKWEKKQTASPLGGMLEFTVALVEFENGSIETRNPQHIRFADSAELFKQFAFDEEREAKT